MGFHILSVELSCGLGIKGGCFVIMNEAVRKQNKIELIRGRRRPSNNELWVCIGCILLVVICIKGIRIWKKLEEENRNIYKDKI